MAGERTAFLTVRAAWSDNQEKRGHQTEQVRFLLDGTWETYRRGGNADEYVVPDQRVSDLRAYVIEGVRNLLPLIRATITRRGLPYTVSEPRDAGNDAQTGLPLVDFDIGASVYDRRYNLDFNNPYRDAPTGWLVVQNQDTLLALAGSMSATDAGIFGSATGSARVDITQGNTSAYTYVWTDDATATTAQRTNLVAGTYRCTVTDGRGVSAVFTAVIGQDARLEVQVVATDTSITLVPSGGRAPYTYAWIDGPTSATRSQLTPGTYACLVTDSRGATREVSVTLSAYQFFWSQNPVTLALDAGDAYRTDPTTKPNLSFLCQVWVEPTYLSGTFVQAGVTLEQPADAQGRTVFDVQALLAAYLGYHVPDLGAPSEQRADPLFRRFFLQHAEQFGEVPVAQTSVALVRNYVVLGGLNFYQSQARTWFTRYQPDVKPFLSWEPTTKYVFADQPEYLYYLVSGNPGSFRYQVRVQLSDGSQEVSEYGSQDAVRDFEVYCLPVGYQALNLARYALADTPVVWWEVFVTTPGRTQVLSETRRFVLDRRVFPYRRYFLFGTSLGGMATYAALGEAQLDLEVTGEEAARTLPPGYDPQLGDVAVASRALRPVLKVASGARTQAQLLASQDLLLSRRVLLLAAGRWVPGFLKAKTVNLLDESKLVLTQEFEFTMPTEHLYTPVL